MSATRKKRALSYKKHFARDKQEARGVAEDRRAGGSSSQPGDSRRRTPLERTARTLSLKNATSLVALLVKSCTIRDGSRQN